MANKLKHMEPTDESDGFVNITPDPNGPTQVGEHFCIIVSTALPIYPAFCDKNGRTSEESNVSPAPPRRPATRSQTNTTAVTTRGGKEDAHADANQGEPSSSKRTLDDMEADDAEDDYVEKQSVAFNSGSFSRPLERPPPSQYTFLETYTSASQSERRGPRTRTAPPVPVPNLTKKSRGRRVPTKIPSEKEGVQEEKPPKEGVQKGGRVYVCKVEDCGKCFSRGEHLKRHIRSIHTHEKRQCNHFFSRLTRDSMFCYVPAFKCSYPSCDKFFNRHDNLLQHQKVHKDYSSPQNMNDSYGPLQRIQQGPHYNSDHAPPTENIIVPQPYAIFSSYHHGPLSGSIGFGTNMAVSSLRTELSPSQVEPPPLPPSLGDGPPPQSHYRASYEHGPPPQMNTQLPQQGQSQPPNGQDIGEGSEYLFR